MSFLAQTNEDFIKLQMRSLLSNPHHKKQLKQKLKTVGLYTIRTGFSTYKYFIDTELNKRKSKSLNSRYKLSSYTPTPNKAGNLLPKLATKTNKTKSGILNSSFCKKGKIQISWCVLYKIINKINIRSGTVNIVKDVKTSTFSEIKNEFSGFYLCAFINLFQNLSNILPEGPLSINLNVNKVIATTFNEINH